MKSQLIVVALMILSLIVGFILGASLFNKRETVTVPQSTTSKVNTSVRSTTSTWEATTTEKNVKITSSDVTSTTRQVNASDGSKKVMKEVRFNYWTSIIDGVAYLNLNVSGPGLITASLSYPTGKVLDLKSFQAPGIVKLKLCDRGRGLTPIFGRYLLTFEGISTYNLSFAGPNLAFNSIKLGVALSGNEVTLDSLKAVLDNRGDLPAIAKKLVVEVDGKRYEYPTWIELPVRKPKRFSKNLGIGLTPAKHRVKVRLLDQKCTGEWRDLAVYVKSYAGPKLRVEDFGVKVERTQSGDLVKWIRLEVRNVGDLPVVVDSVVVDVGSKYSFTISPAAIKVNGKVIIQVDVEKPLFSREIRVSLYSSGHPIATFSKSLP